MVKARIPTKNQSKVSKRTKKTKAMKAKKTTPNKGPLPVTLLSGFLVSHPNSSQSASLNHTY